jgi:HEPN domain-containing protein
LSAPSATLQSMKVSLSMTANETQREAQRAEARRWFAIADRDLATAAHCLSAVPPLIESAAYCCQQAAEKLMKGLLVAAARTFPKTHDLKELAGRASPVYPHLASDLRRLQPLTIWGFAYRYPFEEEPQSIRPALQEIESAIGLLRELQEKAGRQVAD